MMEIGFSNVSGIEDPYNSTSQDSLISIIATSVILGLMTFTTIVGNVFVIAAIILERHLRNVANYLILSLAVADLLVAVLVMPLGAVYEISKKWTLGPQLCDMWTSSDVLCCTASILHLLAIAIDRYWAVTQVHYIHSRTFRTIGTMILIIWFTSVIVSLAPLFGWKDDEFQKRVNVDKVCLVSQEVSYQVFATMATFYIPLIIILLLYWRIFVTARARLRNRLAQKAHVPSLPTERNPLAEKPLEALMTKDKEVKTVIVNNTNERDEEETRFTEANGTEGYFKHGYKKCQFHQAKKHANCGVQTEKLSLVVMDGKADKKKSNFESRNLAQKSKKHVSLEAKRERKAAKTLAIVTGAFIACWLPFFILAVLMPIYKSWTFDPTLVSFFLWLGYFNSTLNPIIYTVFSPEFRTAFQRILCGKTTNRHHRPRHLQ